MAASKRASLLGRKRLQRHTHGNLQEERKSQDAESDTSQPIQPLIFACDLSYRIFDIERVSALCKGTFRHLQVLLLAGSCITPETLARVLQEAALLQKLDVSDCGLPYLPDSQVWAGLASLRLLFMHRNSLTSWEDVEAPLSAPKLQWLTLFESPVVSQPDVRGFIIRRCPNILAVDLCAVTDDERICYACPFPWNIRALIAPSKRKRADGWSNRGTVCPVACDRGKKKSEPDFLKTSTLKRQLTSRLLGKRVVSRAKLARFSSGVPSGERLLPVKSNATSAFAARAAAVAAGETEESAERHAREQQNSLIEECGQQVAMLRDRWLYCSAASAIQKAFRAYSGRQEASAEERLWHGTVTSVQKHGRAWLGKKKLVMHLQELLSESNDLDLLLSAKEMLTIRANKLVEKTVRRWVQQRKDRRKTREAATNLGRYFRGFMARSRVLASYLEPVRYHHVYFPASYVWEFRVLLNMARQQNQMCVLPADYEFETADILGVRIPQVEELPTRNGTLTKILNFRNSCLVRRCRSGKFPQHQWDGPFHKIIDHDAPERIKKAYNKLKRRACNVDNHCRKAFLTSCVPGSHPITRLHKSTAFEQESQLGFTLQKLLNSPEESWSSGQQSRGVLKSLLLRHFMKQAKHLDAPPQSRLGGGDAGNMKSGYGAIEDDEGLKVYRDTVWLSQALLRYRCESPQLQHTLLSMVTQFPGVGGDMPLIRQVPFIAEKSLTEACAAACIQATYRSYRTRKAQPCSLFVAAVLRRATICIQRHWRWSLMKRRLELLTAALKYVDGITTDCLYIEERLYKALNLINCVDRYAPLIHEHNLALGYSTVALEMVLVRSDLRGCKSMRDRYNSSRAAAEKDKVREHARRIPTGDPREEAERLKSVRGGLPDWMWNGTGVHEPALAPMQESGPEDPSLASVCGLQGLLLSDIGEPQESQIVTQFFPTIQHKAQMAKLQKDQSSKALLVCGGSFRFLPLKFANLTQAKRRALAIFLGTFSARHRVAVPLLHRQTLVQTNVCYEILRLWDIYGLTYQPSDRTFLFQLKRRYMSSEAKLVSICGSDSWRNIGRKDNGEQEKRQPEKPAVPPESNPRNTIRAKARASDEDGEVYDTVGKRTLGTGAGEVLFARSKVQGITARALNRSNMVPSASPSPVATPQGSSKPPMKTFASPHSVGSVATTASPKSLDGGLPYLDRASLSFSQTESQKISSARRGTPSAMQMKSWGQKNQHLKRYSDQERFIDVAVDEIDVYAETHKQAALRRGTAAVKGLAGLFHNDKRHSVGKASPRDLEGHRRVAMHKAGWGKEQNELSAAEKYRKGAAAR